MRCCPHCLQYLICPVENLYSPIVCMLSQSSRHPKQPVLAWHRAKPMSRSRVPRLLRRAMWDGITYTTLATTMQGCFTEDMHSGTSKPDAAGRAVDMYFRTSSSGSSIRALLMGCGGPRIWLGMEGLSGRCSGKVRKGLSGSGMPINTVTSLLASTRATLVGSFRSTS